jgi:hypothetical protein
VAWRSTTSPDGIRRQRADAVVSGHPGLRRNLPVWHLPLNVAGRSSRPALDDCQDCCSDCSDHVQSSDRVQGPDRGQDHVEGPAGDLHRHPAGHRAAVHQGCPSTGTALPGDPEAGPSHPPRTDSPPLLPEILDHGQQDGRELCPSLPLVCQLICLPVYPLVYLQDGGDHKTSAAGGTVPPRGLLPPQGVAPVAVPIPASVPIFDRAVPMRRVGRAFARPAVLPCADPEVDPAVLGLQERYPACEGHRRIFLPVVCPQVRRLAPLRPQAGTSPLFPATAELPPPPACPFAAMRACLVPLAGAGSSTPSPLRASAPAVPSQP